MRQDSDVEDYGILFFQHAKKPKNKIKLDQVINQLGDKTPNYPKLPDQTNKRFPVRRKRE